MATNVTKMTERLDDIGILGDVRQRFGAIDSSDDSFDDYINTQTAHELMCAWSGWALGSEDWWKDMKRFYDRLQKDC